MGTGVDLLRLLEPAVRPGGLPGPVRAAPPNGPIESRSFDSLLEQARQMGGVEEVTEGAEVAHATSKPKDPGWIRGLAQIDRIENPSLRALVEGAAAAAAGPQARGEGHRTA